jgi:peptidoglycan/LPS O-acetylase OafA/YrhL
LSTAACGGDLQCNVKNNSFFYFWPPVQVPCFLVGIWCWHVFRAYLTGRAALSHRGIATVLSVGALCAAIAAMLGVWIGLANEYAPFFAAGGSAALLLACCSASSHGRIGRTAGAIGRESYAIYLWHFVFAFEAMYLFKDARVLATHGPALSVLVFGVVVAVTLVASYGLSRLTDTLIQRFASRFARGLLERIDMTFAFKRGARARVD